MNERWEAEGAMTLLVSPLIAVLAMLIGCSILDDVGCSDYKPLYVAARMGALGGPIAAFFCVLVSGTLTIDEIGDSLEQDPDFIRFRDQIDRARSLWGILTPYVIGVVGGPIGSAILRAAQLANSIEPLSAARASALGGLFSVPIYYTFWFFMIFILRPCSSRSESKVLPN
ncbi:hypothetical protein CROQUDRAFT_723863 [Cronartium quercuum f. sp. fusiforme G11]|uniref:Uncharacterized protein n=1 Tax=Cronartium quercuum f. sp. fusiforme G11 TaxID=708437 RepID=A0A9P6NER5_9BASI|nr:hypothetical protein CROQUDRAFT_723863 [Cronartium quercuum f. sp. fusiforme G11]